MKRVPHALVLVVLYVLVAYLATPRLQALLGPLGLVISAVLVFGGILGFGLFKLGKLRPHDVGWRFDRLGTDVLLGVAGLVMAGAGLCLVLWVLRGVHPGDLLQRIVDMPLPVRLMAVGMGIGAALAEETLYRGYLQPMIGLVPTAILFDVAHLNFSPTSLVAKLWLGLVFGLLRGRDRSLVAPAVAHMLVWAVFGWM